MKIVLFLLLTIPAAWLQAQKKNDPVYVDRDGVLRWTRDRSEAAFFGVNYTVPFAYGYRSHKALGIDLEKAIDADVYHMSRLGLDAFRVHVWDVEISDSLGNLLENEHLRLFDYLLKKLKERNIKILITPIAFWGNGYPEPDIRTNGFSYVYGKGPSVVKEEAIRAQENYLKQFFTHVNPYTKLSYGRDPDVIAMEINNEPHHSGPKERTTEYINRLAMAVRSTGWTKPVFYNISESPSYADAVVKANVDGHSFQWYPTGLVAGREIRGNFLPNVDQYKAPFGDTIAAFARRAKMVYEFDAGDVMQPIMYPAMARSYRTAGFQWATQFAYDPLYTAYANTEYQTHYLNLVYTPAKAISLLIASRVFHRLPRGRSYGSFPADTSFDVFRVSYRQQLSEMNSDEEFYYTGTTATSPRNISRLKHIAGVGGSPVVEYEGNGAYFLDRMDEGSWRLEILPDVLEVNDPFEKASPSKEVRRAYSAAHPIRILLPDLGDAFVIKGLNTENSINGQAKDHSITVPPGVYDVKRSNSTADRINNDGETAYYIPEARFKGPLVIHRPLIEVSANTGFDISAQVAADSSDKISVELRNSLGQWRTLSMQHLKGLQYRAQVPADMVGPGVINYRIMLRNSKGETYTFPGGLKGNPYAWDEYRNESWQTFVAAPASPLELFSATDDRNKVMLYNTDWRNNKVEYISTEHPGQLVLRTSMTKPSVGQLMAWQFFFGDKVEGRKSEFSSFAHVMIRARSKEEAMAQLTLIDVDGNAYGAPLVLTPDWREIEIPLADFQNDSMLLLPRPYPGFQTLWSRSGSNKQVSLKELEKLELRFWQRQPSSQPASIEVQWIRLKK